MDKRTIAGIIIAVALGIFPAAAFFSFLRTTQENGETLQGFRMQFPVMGTIAGFTLYTKNHQTFLDGCAAGKQAFEKVVKIANLYDASSELSRLNATAANGEFQCSDTMWRLLMRAEKAFIESNGKFDITVKPLMDLWGFYRKQQHRPTDAEIRTALQKSGFEKLHFDRQHKRVKFSVPGMAIDLGGIAKGYAADLAAEAIQKKGITRGVIDLGGNLKLLPEVPPGKKCYTVGIRNPAKKSELLPEKLQLYGGMAVASSGDYERFTILDGQRFGHIIDPGTGCPEAFPAVTVVSRSALDADIFSTSCYLGKNTVARKLQKLYPDLQVYFFPADK